MSKPDGGPAFAGAFRGGTQRYPEVGYCSGMTLRDYFAGQAIAALITADLDKTGFATVHGVAADAYKVADAMIAERAK